MDEEQADVASRGAGPAIATTPQELTPAWLTDALGADRLEGARVVEVDVRPLGTGQMCDSLRVRLTYDAGPGERRPDAVVVKQPAADETSRATALALRSYEKEVRFYQELAPQLPVRTPAAFHADIDVTTADFVLVLEDLAPAEQGDQLVGCSVEEAVVAVDELVHLHAPRWGDPALRGLDWLHQDPEVARAVGMNLLPALWDGFRERYAADLDPDVHRAGDVLFEHLERYLDVGTDHRTVVHGDYRLDNLLFAPPEVGGRVAVVDWQTCTVGAAAGDVAYFLGAGLPEDERRAVEEDLVGRYHDALVAAGVQGYGRDRCWVDYRRGTWAGLVMAVGASMLVERTERGDLMFLTMATRHARHALDLDAADLLTA